MAPGTPPLQMCVTNLVATTLWWHAARAAVRTPPRRPPSFHVLIGLLGGLDKMVKGLGSCRRCRWSLSKTLPMGTS